MVLRFGEYLMSPVLNFSRTDDIHLNDCYKYFQGETLHLKFCKSILGLNRKSVNHASFSELGKYPLHYDIVKTI